MLRQRHAAGGGVVHGVELAITLAVVAADAEIAAGRVAEVFVLEVFADLGQTLEVVRLVAGLLDDHRLLGFREILDARVGGVGGIDWGGDLGLRAVALPLAQLQNRVVLKLLLDPLFQRLQRELKDLHRLDHPRREELPLLQPDSH
jgi:hypothetical protein